MNNTKPPLAQTPDATKVPSASEELQLTRQLPKIVRFGDLAPCGEELWIENNGQIYRLRRTKQGKLILTK